MKDIFRLDGKTIVVIGAGSGIGRAVALGAAQQGARVACVDVNEESARAAAAAIVAAGGGAEHRGLDITDAAATDRVLDACAQSAGRLDGLVCTPSINVRKKLLDYAEDEFDRVVRVNLKGSFNVLRSAGRIMTGQGGGRAWLGLGRPPPANAMFSFPSALASSPWILYDFVAVRTHASPSAV